MNTKGGDFLLKSLSDQSYTFPEDFNEEQRMIRDTVRSFVMQEILPLTDRIEKLEEGLIPSLMEQFAQLGLFGTHMPEEYGGSDMDYITNSIIGEEIGPSGSFSVSYNAHTGIGMLPLLYYGTEEQKQKYLPGLIDGSIKASYCLTEPSSGSDALSAKSTATLSADGGHYLLNGQKMWITNAGFADLFTVFAQVDGNKFTAFLLQKGMDGLTLGAEEKKLGIKGSSTRMVFMENVKVPVENVLGEVGKGHLIAFNVLNTGRYKLGDSCLGGCKKLCNISLSYANEREQFKVPIGTFGAIKYKIAEQVLRTYTLDAAVYRTASLIQDAEKAFKSEGMSFGDAKKEAAEEFAIECSIIKILGSEVLDYVVDETVQIYGGMGYSEEGDVARSYRDSRINRIFEGTNEVNRLIILNTIMRRAMKGEFDLMTPGMAVQNELMNGVAPAEDFGGKFAEELKAVSDYKKVLIMLLGTAAQQAMSNTMNLKNEQEILMHFADIIIDIFALESAVFRAKKDNVQNSENGSVIEAIIHTLAHDINGRIVKNGTDAIASFIAPNMQSMFITGLRKFTKYPLRNVKENRRIIADFALKAGEYTL
ncbi:MAG: acyl-CoA dehydrogenase family protein [Saprospiraceae bacterium]